MGILAASRQKYKLQQVAKETLNHCNSAADGFGCLARAHIVCEALNKQTKKINVNNFLHPGRVHLYIVNKSQQDASQTLVVSLTVETKRRRRRKKTDYVDFVVLEI